METCIEVQNVVKRFRDQVVLKNVSISFEKGQIHGIVGRNGSGKTVLFKCICGTALVLWNMVTYKTAYWFVNVSPVSWVNLSRVDYDGSSIYPSLTYILLALLGLFAALSAASWVTLRRRNIDVLKSV